MEIVQTSEGENLFSQYHCCDGNSSVIVVGRGAPSSCSMNLDIESVVKGGCDIIIPDYIGSWRSDGDFTPAGCIESIRLICDRAREKYEHVTYVGVSFGGMRSQYIEVDSMFLLAPVLNPLVYGSESHQESAIEKFFEALMVSHYNVYRGFDKKQWNIFFDAHQHTCNLGDDVVILHGKEDTSIHYSRSEKYALENNIHCVLYDDIGHDSRLLWNRLIEDFLFQ